MRKRQDTWMSELTGDLGCKNVLLRTGINENFFGNVYEARTTRDTFLNPVDSRIS